MNLDGYFQDAAQPQGLEEASFSDMALGMASSRILVIAYAVRARIEAGADVANFTVGDFKPSQFQIPSRMQKHIMTALEDNQTNYPPAHGTPELRSALRLHYKDSLGLDYPESAFIVGSGARPILYAAYRCLLDPGEVVLTPAPSWNNKNFCHLVGARHINVPTQAADGFMPTADALRPHIQDARLLVLCSPMNPAGTMMTVDGMRAITDLVLSENQRRLETGGRLLYVIYDQVYRLLTFGQNQHVTPVQVAPEMARYTLFTDAVSKGFAGTGLRVGWLCGPPFIAARIKALMTHMGAWAPRPEQIGTAAFLLEKEAIDDYLTNFKRGIRDRLDRLYEAFAAWKEDGLPIDVIPPQGAIYLSVRFDLEGRPGLPDEDAVLTYLLEAAGCAVVPFSAFGDTTNKGWVRFSVGAVSVAEVKACLPRLRTALENALNRS